MNKDKCIEAHVEYSKQQRKAKEKKEDAKYKKDIKKKHKTKGSYLQDLQKIVNEFIRERDKNQPCISCDAKAGTYKLTAGHFWPTTYGILRFNEDNIHSQCWYNCNKNRHGNVGEYRIRLIKKIGVERVKELDDTRQEVFIISIPEILELKEHYKQKIKDLKR